MLRNDRESRPSKKGDARSRAATAEKNPKAYAAHKHHKSSKYQSAAGKHNAASYNVDGSRHKHDIKHRLTSKFNIVTTTVDIGGIKSKTEKVLICIDTGKYLMTDERGGHDTYKAIREDIKSS